MTTLYERHAAAVRVLGDLMFERVRTGDELGADITRQLLAEARARLAQTTRDAVAVGDHAPETFPDRAPEYEPRGDHASAADQRTQPRDAIAVGDHAPKITSGDHAPKITGGDHAPPAEFPDAPWVGREEDANDNEEGA